MLQRKQSLFLALAALLAFSTWLFPIASYQRGETTYELRTSGLFTSEGVEVVDVGLKMPFSIVLTLLGVALLICRQYHQITAAAGGGQHGSTDAPSGRFQFTITVSKIPGKFSENSQPAAVRVP